MNDESDETNNIRACFERVAKEIIHDLSPFKSTTKKELKEDPKVKHTELRTGKMYT